MKEVCVRFNKAQISQPRHNSKFLNTYITKIIFFLFLSPTPTTTAVLAIVSLTYSELSDQYDNPSVKRGWTTIVGWVAVGESIVACIFAILLTCIKPQQGNVVDGQMLYETGSAGSTGSVEFEMR